MAFLNPCVQVRKERVSHTPIRGVGGSISLKWPELVQVEARPHRVSPEPSM